MISSDGGQVSNDGIGGEDVAFWGLQNWESLKDGELGQIRVGLMGNVLDLQASSLDDGSDLSISGISDSLSAVMKLHDLLLKINN